MILLITCAFSVGTTISLWKANRQMNENSVKFRMIRQYYPVVARWADKTYHREPEKVQQQIEQQELHSEVK